MKSKTCMITGANSGIGYIMARELARMNAHIVMVCRSKERGEAARKKIIKQTKNESVDLLIADLSSMKQVRKLAEEFKDRYDNLHLLINNAVIWPTERMVTVDGLEMQFAVNHLSHLLLTNLLLDVIKASAPARIVNVSSGIHKRVKLDFDDLQSKKKYKHMWVYGRTKLMNVYFTHELARRLKGTDVTVNAFTPGMTSTNLGRFMSSFAQRFMRVFGRSPEKGASTGVYLASSPEVEGVTGMYFANCRERKSSKVSYDEAIARRLWKVSETLADI
ncbi:MAG: SDR family oxidoreductase [Methanomassiliicoccales archaeon]|nr:MAG: SDR family oxidoreductase [Methanomassiliicoccales archaeon]